jgi:hypothetical protein
VAGTLCALVHKTLQTSGYNTPHEHHAPTRRNASRLENLERLKARAPDAPEKLEDAPRKIREAILAALLLTMELRNTPVNPFT